MTKVLILYYSKNGSTEKLAHAIAQGAESSGCEAVIRTVPPVSDNINNEGESIPQTGDIFVTLNDIEECDGIALGSPTHFGNMAAPLKYFLDKTTPLWLKGSLVNKPAVVFTTTSSLHGGQESTLLSMMLPLLHHGAVILGLPYSEKCLHSTSSGGTPYGPTSIASHKEQHKLTKEEQELAISAGKRLGQTAIKLK